MRSLPHHAAFTGENLIGFLLLATAFPLVFSLVWIGSPP